MAGVKAVGTLTPLSITYTVPEKKCTQSDKIRKPGNVKNPNFPTL